MNKQSITRAYGKTALQAKANSPHIFFGVGLAGIITSAVLACRATLKLEKELDQIKLDLDSKRQNKELIESSEGEYTQKDYARDMSGAYLKSSLTVVRLYAPSIVIGSVSVACLTGSHAQLTRRNTALSGTLALMGQAFTEYRDRVRLEVGEERELEIYRCMDDNTIELEGKKVLAKTKDPDAPAGGSIYAVCFDEKSTMWQKSVEMNRMFIQLIENQANMRLKAYGYVFLNDVLSDLGLPKTQAGQIVGWRRFSDVGDGYIDFCMYDAINSPTARIPYDRSIWLDFNVDGPIHQYLE